MFSNDMRRYLVTRTGLGTLVLTFISLLTIPAAWAHHPFGGGTPSNFIQGLLSGLGHPVIGLDHLAFVVAIGLLAVLRGKKGLVLPLAFTVATALGTLTHLQSIDLPLPELIIAVSVLAIGLALGLQRDFNLVLLTILGSTAGLFHGFAYGEAIFGAEMTPTIAYLIGFASIQLVISAIAFYLGQTTLANIQQRTSLPLRFAGSAIAGIGITFLSGAILG